MRKSLNARLVTFFTGAVLLLSASVACAQPGPPGEPAAEPPGEPAAEPPGEPAAEPPGEPAAESPGAPAAEPPGERGGGQGQPSLDIIGLTDDNRLVQFSSDNPSPRETGTIRGLEGGDTRLVGIDYRIQDGRLYGVGDRGGLYTLEPNGQATSVGRLTIALEGTNFGVDFNPAANALRVVSDTGQNLRQPFAATPLPATVADTQLSNPPAAPPATGITAAAYTNNDADPNTATTLYDVDTTADQIVIQSPANAGLLATTGRLTVDAAPTAGFDIYSVVRGGSVADQMAFATLQVAANTGSTGSSCSPVGPS
ncbi:MAG: DUF4394 domain-containing protein [Actinomycetota bacterium]|nr:DUF4394 domain-containing protein [Actinomycetota bacterium]